eukprot:s2510_g10.t2
MRLFFKEKKNLFAKLSWVYEKVNIATVQDVFYLQAALTDPRLQCGDQGLLLTMSNQSWDFRNLSANYIELFGQHVACLEATTSGSPVDLAFTTGKAKLKVSHQTADLGDGLELTLGRQSCPAPRLLTAEQVEKGEEGLLAEEVLIDDPSTSTPNDFSLHPCDCFPTSWGANSPVTAESYASVPAGNGNVYKPATIEIMTGSYMCAQNAFVEANVMENAASCQHSCELGANCSFFWFGSLAEIQQCRLYNSSCASLVYVEGASGTLTAMPQWWPLCHRADPTKCWAMTNRRNYLGAGTGADKVLATSGACPHEQFHQQCDAMQLLGGLGVEKCSSCKYAFYGFFFDKWEQKRRLPTTFRAGARLTFSCWSERYTSVTPPDITGKQFDSYTVACTGKDWYNPKGLEGLRGFACGACVQIMAPDYAAYQEQQVQELYFLPNLQFRISEFKFGKPWHWMTLVVWPLTLTRAGTLYVPLPPDPYVAPRTGWASRLWQVEIHPDASAALWAPEGCLLHARPERGATLSLLESSKASTLACNSWCATSQLGNCSAEPGATFLCSRVIGRAHCLVAFENRSGSSSLSLRDPQQACPTSFHRRELSDALEDASLLQFRRGADGLASCQEVLAWLESRRAADEEHAEPEKTYASFSAKPVSSRDHGWVRFLQRTGTLVEEEDCLQFTGAGTLNVGKCNVNSSFTQESLLQSLRAQKLFQGFDVFAELPSTAGATGSSSLEFLRECWFVALQNFSLSDPTNNYLEPRKMLQGCGMSPVSQDPIGVYDALEGRKETLAGPVIYFMYGDTACVVKTEGLFSAGFFELVDPCFKGTETLNLKAAFRKQQGSNGPDSYLDGSFGLARSERERTVCLFVKVDDPRGEISDHGCDKVRDGYQQVIWSEKLQALKAGDADRCWRVVGHTVKSGFGARSSWEEPRRMMFNRKPMHNWNQLN